MKKILIIVFSVFLLTGCDLNKDFTKVCKQTTEFSGYKEDITTTVNYNNKDEVTKVVIEKKYIIEDKATLESIKESTESYNNKVSEGKGITIDTNEDKNSYNVSYNLDISSMSDTNLKQFDIKENSIKYFNLLKKNGAFCS